MPRVKKIYDEPKKKSNNTAQIIILYEYLLRNKDMFFDKFFEIILNDKIKIFVIDFFITVYSNKKNIIIETSKDNYIDVYNDYKTQLKSYNKKYFDPYKRFKKIELEHKNQKIITTIGQMNFFKWLITNNIIDYIEKNYDYIYQEFKVFNKK